MEEHTRHVAHMDVVPFEVTFKDDNGAVIDGSINKVVDKEVMPAVADCKEGFSLPGIFPAFVVAGIIRFELVERILKRGVEIKAMQPYFFYLFAALRELVEGRGIRSAKTKAPGGVGNLLTRNGDRNQKPPAIQ